MKYYNTKFILYCIGVLHLPCISYSMEKNGTPEGSRKRALAVTAPIAIPQAIRKTWSQETLSTQSTSSTRSTLSDEHSQAEPITIGNSWHKAEKNNKPIKNSHEFYLKTYPIHYVLSNLALIEQDQRYHTLAQSIRTNLSRFFEHSFAYSTIINPDNKGTYILHLACSHAGQTGSYEIIEKIMQRLQQDIDLQPRHTIGGSRIITDKPFIHMLGEKIVSYFSQKDGSGYTPLDYYIKAYQSRNPEISADEAKADFEKQILSLYDNFKKTTPMRLNTLVPQQQPSTEALSSSAITSPLSTSTASVGEVMEGFFKTVVYKISDWQKALQQKLPKIDLSKTVKKHSPRSNTQNPPSSPLSIDRKTISLPDWINDIMLHDHPLESGVSPLGVWINSSNDSPEEFMRYIKGHIRPDCENNFSDERLSELTSFLINYVRSRYSQNTLLHMLTRKGDSKKIKILMEHGVQQVTNQDNETCIQVAERIKRTTNNTNGLVIDEDLDDALIDWDEVIATLKGE